MATVRVPIRTPLLEWACGRAGYTVESFAERHPGHKIAEWISSQTQPTLKQLEAFANLTHTPIGALFLREPPHESLPIPDFRSMSDGPPRHPSANLLDTIYLCQQRQDWYRSYARTNRVGDAEFVGITTAAADPEAVANQLRAKLAILPAERHRIHSWSDALSHLIENAEAQGALVMTSGVVGSNNRRKLDPQEFRGFTLTDRLAPLVFINGCDTKAAQIFTLAHEIGHLSLDESALDDTTARMFPDRKVEQWCNRFAAELLVPRAELTTLTNRGDNLNDQMQRLAEHFKVSTLVILRRLFDLGRIERDTFWNAYDAELDRLREFARQGQSGGNFYYTTMARAGRRLTRALISSALEGQGSFTESLHLLGFRKMATFNELARLAGVTT